MDTVSSFDLRDPGDLSCDEDREYQGMRDFALYVKNEARFVEFAESRGFIPSNRPICYDISRFKERWSGVVLGQLADCGACVAFLYKKKVYNFVELVEKFGTSFINGAQEGLLEMMWSRQKCPHAPIGRDPVPPSPLIPVFGNYRVQKVGLRILGPLISEVQCYVGVGVGPTFTYGDIEFQLCPGCSQESLTVPDSIKSLMLTYVIGREFIAGDLTDALYYQKGMDPYNVWSFPMHRRQMEQLVAPLPLSTLLILPGDGCGVGARVWKGQVVAGDQVHTSMTHASLRKETLMETFQRGCRRDLGQAVIIFSYCWRFLSEEEKKRVMSSGKPLWVIESTNYLPMPAQFRLYGPGLFGMNIPDEFIPAIFSAERNKHVYSGVLYSENLLTLVSIVAFSYSEHLDYLIKMRPMVPVQFSPSYKGNVPICNEVDLASVPMAATVEDFVMAMKEYPGGDIYFAPIGRKQMVPQVLSRDHLRGFVVLRSRHLYVVEDQSDIRKMMIGVPHYVRDRKIYFFCSGEEGEYKFEVRSDTSFIRGSLRFVDMVPVVPIVRSFRLLQSCSEVIVGGELKRIPHVCEAGSMVSDLRNVVRAIGYPVEKRLLAVLLENLDPNDSHKLQSFGLSDWEKWLLPRKGRLKGKQRMNVPKAVRGVKDDGLGGFNPFGSQQMGDSFFPCRFTNFNEPQRTIKAEGAMNLLVSHESHARYRACTRYVSDYDYKVLMMLLDYGVWSGSAGVWVDDLTFSGKLFGPLAVELNTRWRYHIASIRALPACLAK
jgi:hypothetical protein